MCILVDVMTAVVRARHIHLSTGSTEGAAAAKAKGKQSPRAGMDMSEEAAEALLGSVDYLWVEQIRVQAALGFTDTMTGHLLGEWEWSSQRCTGVPTTSLARHGHTAIVMGTDMVVFGGIGDVNRSTGDGNLTDRQPPPSPHLGSSTRGRVGQRYPLDLMLCPATSVMILDMSTWCWHTVEARENFHMKDQGFADYARTARAGHTATVYADTILVIGGRTGDEFHNGKIIKVLAGTGGARRDPMWTEQVPESGGGGGGARYPDGRMYHTAALRPLTSVYKNEGQLFVFGGEGPRDFCNDTWEVHVSQMGGRWKWHPTKLTPDATGKRRVKPPARCGHAAFWMTAATGERAGEMAMVVAGGCVKARKMATDRAGVTPVETDRARNEDLLTKVWLLQIPESGFLPVDETTGQDTYEWVPHDATCASGALAPHLYQYASTPAVQCGSRIIFTLGQQLQVLHCADFTDFRWTKPRVSGSNPTARAWHSAVSVGDRVLMFGGCEKFPSALMKMDSSETRGNGAPCAIMGDVHMLNTTLCVDEWVEMDKHEHAQGHPRRHHVHHKGQNGGGKDGGGEGKAAEEKEEGGAEGGGSGGGAGGTATNLARLRSIHCVFSQPYDGWWWTMNFQDDLSPRLDVVMSRLFGKKAGDADVEHFGATEGRTTSQVRETGGTRERREGREGREKERERDERERERERERESARARKRKRRRR